MMDDKEKPITSFGISGRSGYPIVFVFSHKIILCGSDNFVTKYYSEIQYSQIKDIAIRSEFLEATLTITLYSGEVLPNVYMFDKADAEKAKQLLEDKIKQFDEKNTASLVKTKTLPTDVDVPVSSDFGGPKVPNLLAYFIVGAFILGIIAIALTGHQR